jgi:transmembrane serine protease 8
MFTSNNVWQQVGITSVGIGCARPLLPGIYTRVAAFQSWINDTMNSAQHQILTMSYTVFIPVILLILL